MIATFSSRVLITGIAVGIAGCATPLAQAQAAPRPHTPPPSARVCVSEQDGEPFLGPVTLTTNQGLFAPRFTLNTGGNGCVTFGDLRPGTSYQATVDQTIGTCTPAVLATPSTPGKAAVLGTDGTPEIPATQGTPGTPGRPMVPGEQLVGTSGWRTAPAHGVVDLGRLVLAERQYIC
ncbi:hypothetical protein [Tsukamurella soli]|uniref:Fibronectin type-III domain-containing protein n=1 Tax=Tsukamurella soli TaxID=644556 RepID=A0ABP8KDH0_9ACTN